MTNTATKTTAVPLFNLQQQHESLKEELNKAALEALNSMKWLLGPKTQEFEANFAKALNANYCITCSSGDMSFNNLISASLSIFLLYITD